jgi:nicotinate dehydrogenase subunit B
MILRGLGGEGATYMAAVAKVTVWPSTGKVQVNEVTVAYDCGLQVHPKALQRNVEGGTIQSTSIALHEEVTFDKGKVTSHDWMGYPILTMAEAPKINVVLINRTDRGSGGGSEPAILPALPAIHGAILDATGVALHRTPMSPKTSRQR